MDSFSKLSALFNYYEEKYMFDIKEVSGNLIVTIDHASSDEGIDSRLDLPEDSITRRIGTLGEIEKLMYEFFSRNEINGVIIIVDHIHGRKLIFKDLREIETIQIRRYVRVDTFMDYKVRICGCDGEPGDNVKLVSGRMVNISGGGMRFITRSMLKENTRVFIYLSLREYGMIETKAVVIRSTPDLPTPGIFATAVEFEDLPVEDRERIFAFVMRVQRENSQKNKVPVTHNKE